jgi:hypothetical protein
MAVDDSNKEFVYNTLHRHLVRAQHELQDYVQRQGLEEMDLTVLDDYAYGILQAVWAAGIL